MRQTRVGTARAGTEAGSEAPRVTRVPPAGHSAEARWVPVEAMTVRHSLRSSVSITANESPARGALHLGSVAGRTSRNSS